MRHGRGTRGVERFTSPLTIGARRAFAATPGSSGRADTMAHRQPSEFTSVPEDSREVAEPTGRCASRGHRAAHETDIRFVKGVGPTRARLLEKLGIRTIEDALWFLPRRYEDRSRIVPIARLIPGEKATIAGTIHHPRLRRAHRRNMTLLTMAVRDDTSVAEVVFFNQAYLETALKHGARVVLNGPVVAQAHGGRQMRNPHYELVDEEDDPRLHVGCLAPIYHETRGLSSRQLRAIMRGLLDEYGGRLPDPLPPHLLRRRAWPSLETAMATTHFPDPGQDVRALNDWQTPAHRRLAFEECFLLQLALALRQRMNRSGAPGIAFRCADTFTAPFRRRLPFRLTDAQRRVIAEIEDDMRAPHPMNRLLQGDVGSGKTLVALHTMLAACGDGYQAVLMAPTAILAEQHLSTIRPHLDPLKVPAALLTGSMARTARAGVLEDIARGAVRVVVGTHALLERDVHFARLGVVVVDEQHKFGVLQRGALRDKGLRPDVLVMTATPIPRTLAMTAYGDLDVSVIDELPAGRQPIQTRVFRHDARHRAYELVRKEVQAGRQAYIVYPLVEESDKLDLEAVLQAAERLREREFPAMTLVCLHGRMKSAEKTNIMWAFKAGEIQILAATQVIEVGLDVPNATVMVIEHADWFGLAQLHQLRGRVGRGAQRSCCCLISSSGKTPKRRDARDDAAPGSVPGVPVTRGQLGMAWPFRTDAAADPAAAPIRATHAAEQRLKAMRRCADGFAIAEQDLNIRGPGEVLGTRQWGIPEWRVANPVRDAALLEEARREAFALVERDPQLSHPDHQALKAATLRRWQATLNLGSIG